MRRSDAGFTLFEVLGAVALIGFLYTTLSTVAIRGLRSEGESRRLLEASLRADLALTEIELQVAQGVVPELGSEEFEDEPFTIQVEVSVFQASLGLESPGGSAAGTDAGIRPESVFSGPDSPVREINVAVVWQEGSEDKEVLRTTYAIDPIAAEAAAQSLGVADGLSAGTATTGTPAVPPGAGSGGGRGANPIPGTAGSIELPR